MNNAITFRYRLAAVSMATLSIVSSFAPAPTIASDQVLEPLRCLTRAYRVPHFYSWKNPDQTFGIAVSAQHYEEAVDRQGMEVFGYAKASTFPNATGVDPDADVPNSINAAWFQQQRKRDVELLWRFVFKSILHGGMFNADPHPGNYLFHDDGRISFLDFGCVQRLPPAYLAQVPALHRAALADDFTSFARVGRAAFETRAGDYERALFDYLWRCYEPLRSPRYHVTRGYVAALVRDTQSLKAQMLRKSANMTPVPKGLMLLNRLQFGFWSILARFDVQADYAAVHAALLEQPGQSPAPSLPA